MLQIWLLGELVAIWPITIENVTIYDDLYWECREAGLPRPISKLASIDTTKCMTPGAMYQKELGL